MEIDITDFLASSDMFDLSHSRAEGGPNAGPNTWHAAQEQAAASPLLTTEDQLAECREWIRSLGGWDDAEVAAMSDSDCNALLMQFIAGDVREAESIVGGSMTDGDFDWDAYCAQSSAGRIAGNIHRGDVPDSPGFGRLFFCMDS